MKMLSNVPPPKDSKELWKHFSKTYLSMRRGLFLLAFTMPLVLYVYGSLRHGLDMQPSMSAYFWAATPDQCATFPMRTIFVGYLFAIGVGLFAYKGLTNLENSLLNGAALCAFLVALYPERISPDEAAIEPRVAELFASCPAVEAWANQPALPIHYIAATILFLLLAIVAWFCAEKSLEYLPAGHDRTRYRSTYRIIAIAMLLFPVVGFAIALLLGLPSNKLFFIEASGVLMFGLYWAVKTRELKLSSLESNPAEAVECALQRQRVEAQADQPDTRQP